MAMHPDLKRAYLALHEASLEVARLEVHAIAAMKSSAIKEDLADAAYALRQIETLADDIRKKAAEHSMLAQRLACVLCMALENVDAIKTDHVTATPDVKTIASLPSRKTDPEGFAALMQYLGVPASAYEGGDRSPIDFHWKGIMERVNRDLAEGKPLPPGIDPTKSYPEYRLLMRGGKSNLLGS